MAVVSHEDVCACWGVPHVFDEVELLHRAAGEEGEDAWDHVVVDEEMAYGGGEGDAGWFADDSAVGVGEERLEGEFGGMPRGDSE